MGFWCLPVKIYFAVICRYSSIDRRYTKRLQSSAAAKTSRSFSVPVIFPLMHGQFQTFIYLLAAVISVPVAKRMGLPSVLGTCSAWSCARPGCGNCAARCWAWAICRSPPPPPP